MDELELEPVRVGEEHRVVDWPVLRVVGRRIEDDGADLRQPVMERIDVLAARGVEGDVVEPRREAVVPLAAVLRSGLAQGDAEQPQALVRRVPDRPPAAGSRRSNPRKPSSAS